MFPSTARFIAIATGVCLLSSLSSITVHAQPSTCTSLTTISRCFNNPSYKCYWCNNTCFSDNSTGGCASSACNGTSLASCTTTSTCGWCNKTAAGFDSPCQYSADASMPTGSCVAEWTPNSKLLCTSYTTQEACFDRVASCYWCNTYCTGTYTSSCQAPAFLCYNVDQSACSTSANPTCGWCASPFVGYSKCQFSDNGTQPAACYSSWTPNVVAMCATFSTINECYNMPSATCYWCGSYCTGYRGTTTGCNQKPTCKKTTTQSTCVSTDQSYADCGWCSTPVSGFTNCLYSNNGSQPSACNGTWTPNPGVTCAQWTTKNDCYNNPNYSSCYWCNRTSTEGSYCSSGPYAGDNECHTAVYVCRNANQTSCTSSSRYQTYAFCGWCSSVETTYNFSHCLFSTNGSAPSACRSGWTPNVVASCAQQTTMSSCYNNPIYGCFWCSADNTCGYDEYNNGYQCSLSPCSGGNLSSCTTRSVCGWCNTTAPGFPSNCQASNNASMPTASCSGNWTPSVQVSCSAYTTKDMCLARPGYTCYWCGSYCTATYVSSASCVYSKCASVNGNSSTCVSSYPDCGFCDVPFGGYPACQHSANDGTRPSGCSSGWTPNPAVNCPTFSSMVECFNAPDATCYWCKDSYCTGFSEGDKSCKSSTICKGTSEFDCISDGHYASCGWCGSPVPGFSNCQFSGNGTLPTTSCGSDNWYPNTGAACASWTTMDSCVNFWNYSCYWCGTFCSAVSVSGSTTCIMDTCRKAADQSECTSIFSSRYASCGWCAVPTSTVGTGPTCFHTSGGAQPSMCAGGWTPNPVLTCTWQTTQDSCFNNPNYTSCYWCGTYCSSASTALNCFSSSCGSYTISSCASGSSSSYGNCGFCTHPVGYTYCLYGANGVQPAACLSGWTANSAASPVCAFYTDLHNCTTSPSSCGWCNVPESTYGNCQTGFSSLPSSCTSGWTASTASSKAPTPFTPTETSTKVSGGVIAAAVLGSLIGCGCIVGIVLFLVMRHRRRSRSALLEDPREIPEYVANHSR